MKKPSIVAHEEGRLPLEHRPETLVAEDELGQDEVYGDQGERRDEPAGKGCVGADHCVLNGVGNEQDQHEVHDRKLPDVTLSRQPEGRQNRQVDQKAPQDRVSENREMDSSEVEHGASRRDRTRPGN